MSRRWSWLACLALLACAVDRDVGPTESGRPADMRRPDRVIRSGNAFFAPVYAWGGGVDEIGIVRFRHPPGRLAGIEISQAGDLVWPAGDGQDQHCILVGRDPALDAGVVQLFSWDDEAGGYRCTPESGLRRVPGADLVGAAYDGERRMLYLLDATGQRILGGSWSLTEALPSAWEPLVDARTAPALAHAAEHLLWVESSDGDTLRFRLEPYRRQGELGITRFVRIGGVWVESGVRVLRAAAEDPR